MIRLVLSLFLMVAIVGTSTAQGSKTQLTTKSTWDDFLQLQLAGIETFTKIIPSTNAELAFRFLAEKEALDEDSFSQLVNATSLPDKIKSDLIHKYSVTVGPSGFFEKGLTGPPSGSTPDTTTALDTSPAVGPPGPSGAPTKDFDSLPLIEIWPTYQVPSFWYLDL